MQSQIPLSPTTRDALVEATQSDGDGENYAKNPSGTAHRQLLETTSMVGTYYCSSIM